MPARTRQARYQITAEDRSDRVLRRVNGNLKALGPTATRLTGLFRGLAGTIGLITFGAAIKGAIDLGSRISDLAIQLRIGTRDLQIFQALALDAGVAENKLEAALRNVTLRTEEARLGLKTYSDGFRILNINLDTFAKLDTAGKVVELAAAFERSGESQEAYNALARIFGSRTGPQMIEILQRISREGFANIGAEVEKAGLILDDFSTQRLDRAADQIERFTRRLQITLGEGLALFSDRGAQNLFGEQFALAINKGLAAAAGGVLKLNDSLIYGFEQGLDIFLSGFDVAATKAVMIWESFAGAFESRVIPLINRALEVINKLPGVDIGAIQVAARDPTRATSFSEAFERRQAAREEARQQREIKTAERIAAIQGNVQRNAERVIEAEAKIAMARSAEMTTRQATAARAATGAPAVTVADAATEAVIQRGNQLENVIEGAILAGGRSGTRGFIEHFLDSARRRLASGLARTIANVLGGGSGEGSGQGNGASGSILGRLFGLGRLATHGFQAGGSFIVPGSGGPDTRFVGFRATPGERVSIARPGASQSGSVSVNIQNYITVQGRDEEAIQFAETVSRETEARIIDQQRRGRY